MRFIIHDSNGEMKRLMTCSEEHVEENCGEGESILDVSDSQYDALTTDITALFGGWDVIDGQLTKRPARPSEIHVWDGSLKQWVLPFAGIEALREWKWAQIKIARDDAEVSGFDTPYGRFDSDEASQLKLSVAATRAALNADFTITWTLQDNTTVELNAGQMAEVANLAFSHVDGVHQRGIELRNLIDAAQSFDELEAIKW